MIVAQQTTNTNRRRILKVYTIVEKPGSQRGYWLNIGLASDNRDGSISVKLDALPMNGLLNIREQESGKTHTGRPSRDKQPPEGWQ
ncbi:MAG: hypothetical protein QNJ97_24425 [Myxococcota bacterium]|nr:hypothetical protein [Myxococcota bacterium]